jgi:hypothetical protein
MERVIATVPSCHCCEPQSQEKFGCGLVIFLSRMDDARVSRFLTFSKSLVSRLETTAKNSAKTVI